MTADSPNYDLQYLSALSLPTQFYNAWHFYRQMLNNVPYFYPSMVSQDYFPLIEDLFHLDLDEGLYRNAVHASHNISLNILLFMIGIAFHHVEIGPLNNFWSALDWFQQKGLLSLQNITCYGTQFFRNPSADPNTAPDEPEFIKKSFVKSYSLADFKIVSLRLLNTSEFLNSSDIYNEIKFVDSGFAKIIENLDFNMAFRDKIIESPIFPSMHDINLRNSDDSDDSDDPTEIHNELYHGNQEIEEDNDDDNLDTETFDEEVNDLEINLNDPEFTETDNATFWDIIVQIDWISAITMEDPVKIAKLRFYNAAPNLEIRIRFEAWFSYIKGLINAHTMRRFKRNQEVFAPDVNYGADDCHFIDLPAHLIGKGKNAVQDYLRGNLVDESPVECLSYIFLPDENDGA